MDTEMKCGMGKAHDHRSCGRAESTPGDARAGQPLAQAVPIRPADPVFFPVMNESCFPKFRLDMRRRTPLTARRKRGENKVGPSCGVQGDRMLCSGLRVERTGADQGVTRRML